MRTGGTRERFLVEPRLKFVFLSGVQRLPLTLLLRNLKVTALVSVHFANEMVERPEIGETQSEHCKTTTQQR